MPKTLKPKKMPKPLEARLSRLVAGEDGPWGMTERDARNILAALEYERQRADEALTEIAKHAADFGGTSRGQAFDIFLTRHGRPRAALTWEERDDKRRGRG